MLRRYYDTVLSKSVSNLSADEVAKAPLKLVYSPLNGTGLVPVTTVLERAGVTDITVVPEQRDPDGDFPTCPYPNPEIREAMQKGIELCERVHPDLLLATDPDADRVGVAVKDGEDYLLLTGNEMGVLLLDYICRMRIKRGENLAEKVAVTTIVSSAMVDALAAKYGFKLRRCLTGFKYIGDIITELADEGQTDRFIFGFEESYGYLSGDHVRDKDAVNASLLICQMAQSYKLQGKNLAADAMRDLYAERGYWLNRTVSVSSAPAPGLPQMAAIMERLRSASAKRGCRPRRRERRRLRRRGDGASTRERRRASPGGRQQGHRTPERHRAKDQALRVRERRHARKRRGTARQHRDSGQKTACVRPQRGRRDRKLLAQGRSGEGATASCSHGAAAGKARSRKLRRRGPMQRQGTSCSYEAEAKKRRGASQSGARLPQGLLPLRLLRFGDAIGLSPFSPSRRKRGRGGQKSSICEEFASTNFLPSVPTWVNVERREKCPPLRQISTHISPIFVPRHGNAESFL